MTPDLLVLDINMPLMSGLECIEQIRAQDPDCVILILSGYVISAMPRKRSSITSISIC